MVNKCYSDTAHFAIANMIQIHLKKPFLWSAVSRRTLLSLQILFPSFSSRSVKSCCVSTPLNRGSICFIYYVPPVSFFISSFLMTVLPWLVISSIYLSYISSSTTTVLVSMPMGRKFLDDRDDRKTIRRCSHQRQMGQSCFWN